jgi:hypothetical protein
MATNDEDLSIFESPIREAFVTFRAHPNAQTWTPLSQMYIGLLTVLDGVQALDPTFANPYPLEAADVADGAFYQWPAIPQPNQVLRAMLDLCERRHET